MYTLALSVLLLLQTGLVRADPTPQVRPRTAIPAAKKKNGAGLAARKDPTTQPSGEQQGRGAQSEPNNTQVLLFPFPPKEVDLHSENVPDLGNPNGGKIVFTAELGSTLSTEEPEAGYTSLEDVKPQTGQPFSKQKDLSYSVKAGKFTCEVPLSWDSTKDISYSFVMKVEVDKVRYKLNAKGVVPHLPSWRENLGFTGQILFVSVAVLLSVALAMAIIWFVRRRREPAFVDRPPVFPIQQQARLQQTFREFQSDPYVARPVPPPFQRTQDINLTVKESADRIAALEQSFKSLPNPMDEWRRIMGNVGDLESIPGLVQPRTVQQAARSGVGREEQAILAVVNQWISSGGTNRQEMLSMAGELSQEMKLMEHVNVARVLSDITALGAVDLSESISDGGWLFCSGQDGVGMAAPADSRLFQSELDRTLLQRMFDGVNSGPGVVQFARVYRPCRVRIKVAPNRYEIVQKGLLQLLGQLSPAAPPPSEYLSLRQPVQSPVRQGSPLSLVLVMRKHMETLAGRLAGVENSLNGLHARSAALISASSISDLDQFVLPTIQRQVQQMEQRLKTLGAPAPPAAGPSATVVNRLGADVAAMRNLLRELAERICKVETDLQAGKPVGIEVGTPHTQEVAAAVHVRFPFDDQTTVSTGAAPGPSAARAQMLAPALTLTEAAFVVAKQSVGKSRGLPDSWRDVVGGINAFKGLGERELAEGLKRMQIALQQLPGAAEVRLVHLMETMGKFRVHDATMSPEGQVFCTLCNDALTFQVAVCVGDEGAPELQVLFAAGDYAPYNYPAGYSQLIQGMPNQQFQIQAILTPAVLTLVRGNLPAEYIVKYKLQWR